MLKSLEDVSKNFDSRKIIQIFAILLIAIGAYIVVIIVQRRLKNKLPIQDDLRKEHIYATIFRVVKVLILVAALFGILQTLGVNMSGFSLAFGVILLLIFFAVKDSLQDLFNGFIILTDRYYTVGDAVEYNGRDGIVISFTIRTTKIEYLDDRSVISIANREITKIRRLTHLVDIDLPLPYEMERQEVYTLLEGVCEKIRRIEGVEDCMLKGTQDFGESAILYKIRFFCEPNDRPDIRREVLRTIQDDLEAAGIRIPYRQLDVHQK